MSDYNRELIVEKILNEHHISDISYALRYTRWFLTFLGIWPQVMSNSMRIEGYVSRIALPFFWIVMMLPIVLVVSEITVRSVDRLEILILIGPLSFQTTNILKHFLLVNRADTVKLCIEHMKSDWRRIENPKDRKIMLKNLRHGRGLTIMCVVSMYSGCILYHAIMPLWSGSTINELNETVRPLAYPGSDIYIDSQIGINYEIVFCAICLSAFFHFTVTTATFNLAAVLVTHACGQIQIVMSRLTDLVDMEEGENDSVTIGKRMALIIERHVRVLRFSSRIDKILREICLMEVLFSTVSICFVEHYCLMEWSNGDSVAIITYDLILFSLCFNIFIYCHISELLKEECYHVREVAYMVEWYRLPGKTGLALVMVIAMANYPPKLTAGGIMDLSIRSFGSIIKTSLAYLNILRTIAE